MHSTLRDRKAREAGFVCFSTWRIEEGQKAKQQLAEMVA
jgi:hypothetical protein